MNEGGRGGVMGAMASAGVSLATKVGHVFDKRVYALPETLLVLREISSWKNFASEALT